MVSLTRVIDVYYRLSSMAGHRLTSGNPDIADLSDPYRPTKLVSTMTRDS